MSYDILNDFIARYAWTLIDIGAGFLFVALIFGIIEVLRKQRKTLKRF